MRKFTLKRFNPVKGNIYLCSCFLKNLCESVLLGSVLWSRARDDQNNRVRRYEVVPCEESIQHIEVGAGADCKRNRLYVSETHMWYKLN